MTRIIVFSFLLLLLTGNFATAGDWIFDPGPYTNNPKTGQRVDQYKPLPKVDRIPFSKFFSEDGPHPFGMDYWWGSNYWSGGGYGGPGWMGIGPYGFGGYPYLGPYAYPPVLP